MQKWEYLFVNYQGVQSKGASTVNVFEFNGKLQNLDAKESLPYVLTNKLGGEGWELIESGPRSYVFKRPKQ